MTHDDLIARLRDTACQGVELAIKNGRYVSPHEAADAIERLEAENVRLRGAGSKVADAAYHGEECPMNTTGAYCNCGYDAAAEAWCTALEKTS